MDKNLGILALIGAVGVGVYALANKGGVVGDFINGGGDQLPANYNLDGGEGPIPASVASNSDSIPTIAGGTPESNLPQATPTIFSFLTGQGASESGLAARDVTVDFPTEIDPFTREYSAHYYKTHGYPEQALAMNLVTGQMVWDWRESEGQAKVEKHIDLVGARIRETELEIEEVKLGISDRSGGGVANAAYLANKIKYVETLKERQALVAQGIMTPKSKQQRQLFARDPAAYIEKYG